ncbi:hypothetical protein JHL18_02600 [Clostridium sp. YIM B02505]|uniref:Uncharacterized protein n=1 Tax=Clostridium yunnanense TaxID=2800325 RepID=A0ABS1EJK6_9CLOT|nr:hypothetical protein [Clostridium yunnanense]MBK1809535.1 hypothetical protein [Clostridium yunnanense]
MLNNNSNNSKKDDAHFEVGPLKPIKVKTKKEDILFIMLGIIVLNFTILLPVIENIIHKLFK